MLGPVTPRFPVFRPSIFRRKGRKDSSLEQMPSAGMKQLQTPRSPAGNHVAVAWHESSVGITHRVSSRPDGAHTLAAVFRDMEGSCSRD